MANRETRLVDLSHVIETGMIKYKGLPGPALSGYWTREASAAHCDDGSSFQIGRIDMISDTGTYVDSPFLDGHNIDDTRVRARPVHTLLLGAAVPVCEHMTNLSALPDRGFRVTAAPPKVAGMGTFPVRAFAEIS